MLEHFRCAKYDLYYIIIHRSIDDIVMFFMFAHTSITVAFRYIRLFCVENHGGVGSAVPDDIHLKHTYMHEACVCVHRDFLLFGRKYSLCLFDYIYFLLFVQNHLNSYGERPKYR